MCKSMAGQRFLDCLDATRENNVSCILQTFAECQGKMLVAAIKSNNNGYIAAILDSGADVNFVEHIDEHEEETHVFGYLLNRVAHMSVPLLMFQTVDDVLLNAASNVGQCIQCEKLTGEAGDRTDIAKIYCHCIRQDETPLAEAVVDDNLSPEVTPQALDIVHLSRA